MKRGDIRAGLWDWSVKQSVADGFDNLSPIKNIALTSSQYRYKHVTLTVYTYIDDD